MKHKVAILMFALGLSFFCYQVHGANRGAIIANNIMGGAGAGTLVGFSAGLTSYGFDHHRDPSVLLTSSVYGFIIGAVTGTGIGLYEISTGSHGTGFSVSEYVVGGTGIGALLGIVVAIIPFVENGELQNFTIGAGIGGLIGGAAGLGIAILDIDAGGGQNDVLLSGQIGFYPEVIALVTPYEHEINTNWDPLFSCRLAKFTF